MAVEISNILLCWARVIEDGAGGFRWVGEGVSNVVRNGAGDFSIFLSPQTIDPLRTVWEATSEAEAGGDGTYAVAAFQTINQIDVTCYFDDGVVAPVATDPTGFSFRGTVFNVETPAVAVA